MAHSKSAPWWNKRRVALAGLIVVLVVYLDVAEAIPVIVFPCLAWLVWKRFGISAIALALGVAGLELMTSAGIIAVRSEGNIFTMIPFAFMTVAGMACIVAAVITMLISAWRRPARRRQYLLGALLAPVAAVLLMCAVQLLFQGARHLRIARYFHANKATLQALIDDVGAVSSRLGRVPEDEDELISLRKEPMPRIPWPYWRSHALNYHAMGDRHYRLSFGGIDAEGFYVYDNGTPERGWYRCWTPPWLISDDSSTEETPEETEDADTGNSDPLPNH